MNDVSPRTREWWEFYITQEKDWRETPRPNTSIGGEVSRTEISIAKEHFWQAYQGVINPGWRAFLAGCDQYEATMYLVQGMQSRAQCSECCFTGFVGDRVTANWQIKQCNLTGAMLCARCRSIGTTE